MKGTLAILTFTDYFVEIHKQTRKSFFDDVNRLIDWKPIEKILRKRYRKVASANGRPDYPPVPMFKLLLLQRWNGLSDPGLEESPYDYGRRDPRGSFVLELKTLRRRLLLSVRLKCLRLFPWRLFLLKPVPLLVLLLSLVP